MVSPESPEDSIVGIKILDASKKLDFKTILSYTLELDEDLKWQQTSRR